MPLDAWITIGTVVLLMVALASDRVGTDTAILGALTALLAMGVVTPAEALAGFADPAVLTIGALFVVAAGLRDTGALGLVAGPLLGRPKSHLAAQLRLMIPVAATSAFMNNTPIVALYLPIVRDWAKRLRVSPSRLMIPLSYAAILGGACTLIGTSSNLIVNSLYLDYIDANAAELADSYGLTRPSPAAQFWRLALPGVPLAAICIGFIALTSRWLLPQRSAPDDTGESARKYTVEMTVDEGSALAGKTVEDAGLRQLPGLFLFAIERTEDGRVREIPAVGPNLVLHASDRLVFTGVIESVVDLMKIRGLTPATDQVQKVQAAFADRTVVEAVMSASSPLIGQSVRDSRFRTRFNAAIVAVHRGGERLDQKIGDIVFKPGDTLLLSTHTGFLEAHRNSQHFYLVSALDDATPPRYERTWVAMAVLALLVAMFTLPIGALSQGVNAALGTSIPTRFDQTTASMLCAMLMVFTRCTSGTSARAAINWQVLLTVAGAFGIGTALQVSGAAGALADGLYAVCAPLGPRVLLLVFALATTVITQLITNQAAAVLLFPIAMRLAHDAGVSPEPFVITLMLSAACAFMTPVGYVTNLMVFGPGGYRFTDFFRLGIPLTIVVALVCVALVPMIFPFTP